MSSKSVTALLEKSFKKLKNFLKNQYGTFIKKKINKKRPQNTLRFFWKKSKNLKNVLKKRYGPSGEKVKKLKNVLKKRYVPIET